VILTAKELRICEKLYKVGSISRLDVVALEVQGYVFEGVGISIDVQGSNAISTLVLSKLFFEELREVGGYFSTVSFHSRAAGR